jgi:PiT family inorganic phosphate transporter
VPKSVLDKDLKKISELEHAGEALSRRYAAPGLAALFIGVVFLFATLAVTDGPLGVYVVAACIVAGYMSLNIGANDVANNMGPAVGSKALTMAGALAIAAVCEAAGAILAGGDVIGTIAGGIIRAPSDADAPHFIHVMLAALLAAGVWTHLATFLRAPVSTTHAIVGAVVGSGMAAFGAGVVSWGVLGGIGASWIISPVMGGVLAAVMLAFIKWTVVFRPDKVAAARRWVPLFIGVMSGVFAMYMAAKGLSRVWRPTASTVVVCGVVAFFAATLLSRPYILRRSAGMENRRKAVATLFSLPLVIAAALLSFAHGANDVANAVGPLAAIVAVAGGGSVLAAVVETPHWVVLIGAVGIALGLSLFGARLIRTVGEQITRIDPIRAFCVALSAATTVLIASALGLPVSSTHIAVGGIFGVGFLREALTNKGVVNPAVQPRGRFLDIEKLNKTPEEAYRRSMKRDKRRLVRRRHMFGIIAAWLVTVPASALLSALIYGVVTAMVGLLE